MIRRFGILSALYAALFLSATVIGCGDEEESDVDNVDDPDDTDEKPNDQRRDDAVKISINIEGSLQNPAFSPDGDVIVMTRFQDGYNMEPADLFLVEIGDGSTQELISDGSANVNLPGSSWNPVTEQIVFSSSRDPHDEIYVIDDGGTNGDEVMVTSRDDFMAYEPSFSPDGTWVVFESHVVDTEDNGIIMRYLVDGTGDYEPLTDENADCRQPNWAPAGGHILCQCLTNGQWDLWIMNEDGSNLQQVTQGEGDKTDASFSPNGQWIVYSSDNANLEFANLFVISIDGGDPIQVTDWDGYDGAPSWSSTNQIAFESYHGDPDDSPGTTLWIIDVPAAIAN
ncbi:MAG: PD40 domain-containing protein [Deltaproteobacteria bacterium]|nr:PD40 domain-containing protein [Deltaproteobacteria bacterium]